MNIKADRTPPHIRYEHPDPNPVEAPVRPGPAPNTLAKLLAANRLAAAQALAQENIEETFEEADDFDVDDFQGALEYAKTKWEIAADAALLTPAELFERVYGIPHSQAFPEPIPPAPLVPGTPAPPVPGPTNGNNPNLAQ